VVVHGYVADLGPYLEGCRLSVAPLRYGAGVKGKVNQAMAWGLPVVATGCAAEGMYLEDGEDVLVADTSETFAEAVVRAYEDEALWLKLSDGGLANVEKHFSFDAARRAITELLEALKTS
jgi:glycosyltransferase involved in cell wall biosynthesis